MKKDVPSLMEHCSYSTLEVDLNHCHSSELLLPHHSGPTMHQGRGTLAVDSFENNGSADLLPVLQLTISKRNGLMYKANEARTPLPVCVFNARQIEIIS